jgi:hypothetical protein
MSHRRAIAITFFSINFDEGARRDGPNGVTNRRTITNDHLDWNTLPLRHAAAFDAGDVRGHRSVYRRR